jgi:hypothetical protein
MRKVIMSWHVIFDETQFPFIATPVHQAPVTFPTA